MLGVQVKGSPTQQRQTAPGSVSRREADLRQETGMGKVEGKRGVLLSRASACEVQACTGDCLDVNSSVGGAGMGQTCPGPRSHLENSWGSSLSRCTLPPLSMALTHLPPYCSALLPKTLDRSRLNGTAWSQEHQREDEFTFETGL